MKAKLRFSSMKLNKKFTIVIGIIIIIPMMFIYNLLFQDLKRNLVSQEESAIEVKLKEMQVQTQNLIDLCNLSVQFYSNNQSLNDFLIAVVSGEKIEIFDLIEFNKNTIADLERMVYSNPYLYQIHVYVPGDDVPEMMPIIYNKERMWKNEWASDYVPGTWQFDYTDTTFPGTIFYPTPHLMSLVTEMDHFEYGELGTIEVVVQMETLFPDLFKNNEGNAAFFLDQSGNIYTASRKEDNMWNGIIAEGAGVVASQGGHFTYSQTVLDGRNVLLGNFYIKEMEAYYVTLVDLDTHFRYANHQRNLYLLGIIVIFACLIVVINKLVKTLLRELYGVIDTVQLVQNNDLSVRIPVTGKGEVNELSHQINKMLDNIQRLMSENISRERLAKNSEIRALQNQINAHFIYNVLESIKMMAEIDEKYSIADAVTALGKLLRYSMKWTSGNVSIEEEVGYIRNYLDLINLRFDYEIILAVNIPEEMKALRIPKMCLQPIIENAIVHGIEELAEDTSIYIKGTVFDGYCHIEITDSGKGMTDDQVGRLMQKIAGEIDEAGGSGNGIGLKNVQDRLQIMFGSEYGIRVVSKENCYTKIIVKVPLNNRGLV